MRYSCLDIFTPPEKGLSFKEKGIEHFWAKGTLELNYKIKGSSVLPKSKDKSSSS